MFHKFVHNYLDTHDEITHKELVDACVSRFNHLTRDDVADQLKGDYRRPSLEGMDYTSCPGCERVALGEEEVGAMFGYRDIQDTKYPQSWCRDCR